MKDSRTVEILPAVFSWVIALAAAWLAVSTQAWAQTLLILALGLVYLIFPPQRPLPRTLFLLVCLFLGLSATAFLPLPGLGVGFRQPLLEHGIILPSIYSPQPWLSLESFGLLLTGLLWVWNCLGRKLPEEFREFLMSRYALLLSLVALGTICDRLAMGGAVPFFLRDLGHFENRNQTGDLLVMGGMCSLGHGRALLEKGKAGGIFWVLVALVYLTAIVLNGSRAALVLFGLGLLFFFVLKPRQSLPAAAGRAVIAGTFLLSVALFFWLGSELQHRLEGSLSGEGEERLAIYQDSLAMVARSPWLGVGLGNFEGIFNTARPHSFLQSVRALHPESDWWWIVAESGLGAGAVMAFLVILGCKAYLKKTPFPLLTLTSVIVACLFLIHSFFDVAGHRLGTLWPCIYLTSLGAFRRRQPTDLSLPGYVPRLAGVALLIIGGLRLQSASVTPWMPTTASVTQAEQLPKSAFPAEQKEIVDRALAWSPLAWPLYYQRALLGLDHPELAPHPNDDFERVLFLEQSSPEIAATIGNVCRLQDFDGAMLAWRELLRRVPEYKREEFFLYLNYDGLTDDQRARVDTLADDDPQLKAVVTFIQSPANFGRSLKDFLSENPSLNGVSGETLTWLLSRWAGSDAGDAFIAQWALHPAWHEAGWRSYVEALARRGDEKDAAALTLRFVSGRNFPAPPPVEDPAQAALDFRANPNDAYRGILLYYAQKSHGLDDEALQTLQNIASLPRHPAYLPYLLARDLLQAGQDKAAWQTLEPVLNAP